MLPGYRLTHPFPCQPLQTAQSTPEPHPQAPVPGPATGYRAPHPAQPHRLRYVLLPVLSGRVPLVPPHELGTLDEHSRRTESGVEDPAAEWLDGIIEPTARS